MGASTREEINNLPKRSSIFEALTSIVQPFVRSSKTKKTIALIFDVYLVYRLNTYPLIHWNFFHFAMNALSIIPLLERFEGEHGTLLSGALFIGRMLTSETLSDARISLVSGAWSGSLCANINGA